MKSRLLIILVFVSLLGGLYAVAALRARQAKELETPPIIKPAVVRCAPLEERQYEAKESFWGLIQAHARVDMAFQITGRVAQLGAARDEPLVENQRIRKGDEIARLEPERYQAAVDQARAEIKGAKASMNSAQALADHAQAKLEDAEYELDRFKQLAQGQAANVREVEKAELAVKLAIADKDGAEANLASSEASYAGSRAALSMANVNLQDATLRAPMDATVAAIPTEVGQMVTPAQPVVTLVDLTKVKLVAGVVERKLPLLRRGQKVSIEVQALMAQSKLISDSASVGRPREGIVTVVPPAADPVTGLFNVEIELDNDDELLYPGMVGRATITVLEKTVLAIPASAATRSGNQAWAYFVRRGYQTGLSLGALGQARLVVPAPIATRVMFKPDAFDRDYYLLLEAPAGLEQLIVEGHNRLTDGQTVNVVNPLRTVQADAG